MSFLKDKILFTCSIDNDCFPLFLRQCDLDDGVPCVNNEIKYGQRYKHEIFGGIAIHYILITPKKKLVKAAVLFIALIISFYLSYCALSGQPILTLFGQPDKEELKSEIERLYNIRSSAFVTKDLASLRQLFDVSQRYGQWSLDHEVRRVKYLNDWAARRGVKFTNVTSTVRVKKIYNRGNTVRVSLDETYRFDYDYKDDSEHVENSFGVGIRHTLDLKPVDEGWLIYCDWYTDCFEDAISGYSGEIHADNSNEPLEEFQSSSANNLKKSYYDRQKAVQYADKYCGAAWGSGNDFKYNRKYSDYNGIGGDCTNFASQVLGDKDAGGIPQDVIWHCNYNRYGGSQGSKSWVNASSFKNYLVYSGKGSVIMKGSYNALTKPMPGNPRGAVAKLRPGDLVSYEKKGDIDHFAIVTGLDSKGYPLINSHTTDRYHVPWDLGWDGSDIKFLLIHING